MVPFLELSVAVAVLLITDKHLGIMRIKCFMVCEMAVLLKTGHVTSMCII